jgi:major membrane immunogen (membrane-anchored lipoprotein)
MTARWALLALPLAVLLAGCGEKAQVTVFKKGEYQGRQDTRPWDGDPFKGDKAAWETAIKARNKGQDEYVRLTAN